MIFRHKGRGPQREAQIAVSLGFKLPPHGPWTPARSRKRRLAGVRASSSRVRDPSEKPKTPTRWGSNIRLGGRGSQREAQIAVSLGFVLPPHGSGTPAGGQIRRLAGVRASSSRVGDPSEKPKSPSRWGSCFLLTGRGPQREAKIAVSLGFVLPPHGSGTPARSRKRRLAGVRASSSPAVDPSEKPNTPPRWGSNFFPTGRGPQREAENAASLGFVLPPHGSGTPARSQNRRLAGVLAFSAAADNPSERSNTPPRWGSGFLCGGRQPQREVENAASLGFVLPPHRPWTPARSQIRRLAGVRTSASAAVDPSEKPKTPTRWGLNIRLGGRGPQREAESAVSLGFAFFL